jgi:hypothetical protein
MQDENLDQGGWANRHNFRLSDNGGIAEAVFMNEDAFYFASDVTITGTANVEGGLNLSPWWSKDVDGVMMLRTDDGMVECWGGRLPYYSFTANHIDPNTGVGVRYAKGTTVRLEMTYLPHGLSALDPGTIQYTYTLHDPDGAGPLVGYSFSTPELNFDMGNPNENPPYGLWGILNDARVGGWFMPKVNNQIPGNWGRIEFENMAYVPIPEPASLAALALAALVLRRR